MSVKPNTKYTKSGRINIAYQVFGSGPIDLVYIPGWVSNIDWMWACPELVSFLEELGKMCRVILFDKRGTGLSDRVIELSTLEERMDDIRAVMDDIGSEKAVLFGHSEGGCVSALFAATYPNRVISMITFGIFAKRRYAPEYPWAPTDKERQAVYDMIENSWGSGKMNLESLAPTKANDDIFMDWLANYFRSGASPSAAMVLTKMNTEVDIINILDSIKVPSLIMQRKHDIDVKIEEGRFIADRIKGAKFVELEGNDHLFWVGDTSTVLDEMRAFITNVKPKEVYEERLFTLLAANIIASDNPTTNPQDIIRNLVIQYRGQIVQYNQETFTAIFEGPSKAVHCGLDLIETLHRLDYELSIGVHIKESPSDDVHFINDQTQSLIDAILRPSEPNQILVTEPVKFLLSGAGLNLIDHKTITEPTTGDPLSLFKVTDHFEAEDETLDANQRTVLKNDSFLENVLQVIEKNLSDEFFGVEMLCREIGVSERQVQRKLKAITNKSPNQLISSVRLHRAKELLFANTLNVSEIAFRSGFSNPSYFSKIFKKEFGTSPSDLLR